MDIGIGLPNSVPGTPGRRLVEWARLAEEHGFSTLATTDRIVYDTHEPLTALAAAAAVTTRIRLMTAVLVGPLRSNTALLAKQAATVDQISGGRLVLGMAIGVRPDDFAASGVEKARRAAFLEGQLTDLKRAWSSGAVGPRPVQAGGPPLILGGQAPPAIARAAAAGTGWIAGAVGPELFRVGSKLFTTQWQALGRSGRPRLLALAYFALGPQGPEHAEKFLRHYYASAGPFVERAVRAAAVSAERVRQVVGQFAEAGCDELLFLPCSADMDQVGLLAAALQRTPVAV